MGVKVEKKKFDDVLGRLIATAPIKSEDIKHPRPKKKTAKKK